MGEASGGGDGDRVSSGRYDVTEIGSGIVRRLRNGGVERDLAIMEAAWDAPLEATGVEGGSTFWG